MEENKEIGENEKGLFSEILGGALDLEILNRALSAFLVDNYAFSDFNMHFNPPVILTENEFMALIKNFDDFGFSEFDGRIFMIMVRDNPQNKKRIKIIYVKMNNGKYEIESVDGKTYLNS